MSNHLKPSQIEALEDHQVISRSYRNRVAKGQRVSFVARNAVLIHTPGSSWEENLERNNRLVPGKIYAATVTGEDNAGFRGIEMSVKFDDGTRVHGISTGLRVG